MPSLYSNRSELSDVPLHINGLKTELRHITIRKSFGIETITNKGNLDTSLLYTLSSITTTQGEEASITALS